MYRQPLIKLLLKVQRIPHCWELESPQHVLTLGRTAPFLQRSAHAHSHPWRSRGNTCSLPTKYRRWTMAEFNCLVALVNEKVRVSCRSISWVTVAQAHRLECGTGRTSKQCSAR